MAPCDRLSAMGPFLPSGAGAIMCYGGARGWSKRVASGAMPRISARPAADPPARADLAGDPAGSLMEQDGGHHAETGRNGQGPQRIIDDGMDQQEADRKRAGKMQRPAYGFEGAEDEETDCRDDDDASDNASFEKQFEEVVMGVVHISPE